MKKFLQGIFITIVSLFLFIPVANAALTYPYQGGTGNSTTPIYGQLLVGLNQYFYNVTTTIGDTLRFSTSTASLRATIKLEDLSTTTTINPYVNIAQNANFASGTIDYPTGWATETFNFSFGPGGGDGTGTVSKSTTNCNGLATCVREDLLAPSDSSGQGIFLDQTFSYDPTQSYTGKFDFQRLRAMAGLSNGTCISWTNFPMNQIFSPPVGAAFWDFTHTMWNTDLSNVIFDGFNCPTNTTTAWQTFITSSTPTGDNGGSTAHFVITTGLTFPDVSTDTVYINNVSFGAVTSTVTTTTGTNQFGFSSPSTSYPFNFIGALLHVVQGISTSSSLAVGTNLSVGGSSDFIGAAALHSTLNVTGTSTLASTTINGAFSCTGTGCPTVNPYSGTFGMGQILFGSATNTFSGTNNFYFVSSTNSIGLGTSAPTVSFDDRVGGAFFNGLTTVSSSLSVGTQNVNNGTNTLVEGNSNSVSSDSHEVFLGGTGNSASSAAGGFALGSGNKIFTGNNGAIGSSNTTTGFGSLALGSYCTVNGLYSVCLNASTTPVTINNNNTTALMGGNVGIGTTTPSKALDVIGQIRSSATTTASCFTTDGTTCLGGITLGGNNTWTGNNTFNATTTLATTTINGELNLEWGTPTTTNCGTSPSISGNNHVGTVTIGAGISVTACTINFSPNFASNSKCIAEGINTFTGLDITAQSSSSVTFGMSVSLAGGQFNYLCFE